MIRLRFLFPPKGNPIIHCDEEQPFSTLLAKAAAITGWPVDSILLKNGFPPSPINATSSQPIKEILQNDDGIIIQRKRDIPYQATSSAPPPKKLQHCRAKRPAGSITDNIASLTTTASAKKPTVPRKRSKAQFGTTTDEWASNLLDIFSKSSGNLNTAEKAVKGAFKNAVQRRYCSAIAEKRWAAVQGSSYTLEAAGKFKFTVSYPFGPRSSRSEEYTAIPKELMRLVIKEAYNNGEESRMNLRPYYLAEAQPLIFWNMVRLYRGDIFKGYLDIAPDIDWSFVEDRHRELSAKAKENVRQKNEADAYKASRSAKRLESKQETEASSSSTKQESTAQ